MYSVIICKEYYFFDFDFYVLLHCYFSVDTNDYKSTIVLYFFIPTFTINTFSHDKNHTKKITTRDCNNNVIERKSQNQINTFLPKFMHMYTLDNSDQPIIFP